MLFAKVLPDSLKTPSRLGSMGSLIRHKWWKYFVAGSLFYLSLLSFALFRGD
jgi:hypothetical protein